MINQRSLVAMLKARVSTATQPRAVDGSAQVVSWLPVLHIRNSTLAIEHWYGLVVESGDWAAEYSDHKRVAPPGSYVPFFPLLELPFREVVRLLREGVSAVDLPPIVVSTFPLDPVLEAALATDSHWSLLAERWLDDGYPPNDEMARLVPHSRAVRSWQEERRNAIFGSAAPHAAA